MNVFTVNLEQKLIRAKQKEIDKINKEVEQSENLIKSAKEVIDFQSEEDMKALERAGLYTAINSVKNKQQENILSNEKSKSLSTNNREFTLKEIKSIAIAYNLRFLPSEMYKGNLPNDLGLKIRQFESSGIKRRERHSKYDSYIENDDNVANSKNGYYILAPASNFQLQKRDEDPLMFSLLENGNYYLVHKWGNDLNIGRWFINLFCRTFFIKWLTIYTLITSLVLGIEYTIFGSEGIPIFILSALATLIIGLINLTHMGSSIEKDSWFANIYGAGNNYNWNNKYID